MRQREETYQRDLANHLARARRLISAKFRSQWDSKEPAVTSSDDTDNPTMKRVSVEDPLCPTDCPPRPFLRQKWLERQATAGGAFPSSAFAHARASSNVVGGSVGSQGKQSVVQREHVRSVVRLALSEARVNAFVVVSSLEGLLAVATAGVEDDLSAAASLSEDSLLGHHSLIDDSVCGDGAALCVKLGALPAVLGCLNEHAGDNRIEPLGIGLLYIFAAEEATREAIRGNTDVAAVCAARMFPLPAKDKACGGSTSDSVLHTNAPQSGFDQEHAYNQGDVNGQHLLIEHNGSADDTSVGAKATRLDTKDPDLNVGTMTNCRGPTLPPSSSFTKPLSAVSAMWTEQSSATGVLNKYGSSDGLSTGGNRAMKKSTRTYDDALRTAGSKTEYVAATKPLDKMSAAVSNGGVATPPMEGQDGMTLPAADLVFVMSIALQDSPDCQRFVLQKGAVTAMLATVQHADTAAASNTRLTGTCLRVLEHLGRLEQGRRRLVKEQAVETAISTVERFR